MLVAILRAVTEGVIRGVEAHRGEAMSEEEIRAAFSELARNPPRLATLPDDFPPHSRDLPDAT